MKTKFQLLFTILMITAAFCVSAEPMISGSAGAIQNVDSYWVTFSGDCGCDDIYIMKIDENGNILVPPKAVLAIADVSANTSSLSKNGTTKLNLFHWNKDAKLTRAVIDKATLKVISTKKTQITTKDGGFLQATQREKNNFVLGERTTGPLALFKVSATHVPKSPGWDLDAAIVMDNDEATISADGLVVVSNRSDLDANTPDQIFVQLLEENGNPKGSAQLLAKYTDIEASDVTNPLKDGVRFVVYIVDSGTSPDDKLMLQKIDAAGKKKGAKVVINTPPNREEDNQVVAIDPLGRFVLFTMQGDNYGCYAQDILAFQKLTETGKKSGSFKILVGCDHSSDDIMNLDVLKE